MIQAESSRTNLTPIVIPGCYTSRSTKETIALGQRLAELLQKGSIVALSGALGAGKTCFTKGIAKGLNIEEEVTSPSYTIVSEYEGFLAGGTAVPLYHVDAYRLGGDDDFTAIGGEELVYGNGISVIEWSERIPGFIPPGAFRVDMTIKSGNERLISICMAG